MTDKLTNKYELELLRFKVQKLNYKIQLLEASDNFDIHYEIGELNRKFNHISFRGREDEDGVAVQLCVVVDVKDFFDEKLKLEGLCQTIDSCVELFQQ